MRDPEKAKVAHDIVRLLTQNNTYGLDSGVALQTERGLCRASMVTLRNLKLLLENQR